MSKDLNRRDFLKWTTAGAGAVAASAGASFLGEEILGEESKLSRLMDPSLKVRKSKKSYDLDPLPLGAKRGDPNFRELSEKPVRGAEEFSRAEYISHFFSETESVVPGIRAKHKEGGNTQRWLDTFQEIPKDIRDRLAKIVPGQVAQESKFDNNAFNKRSKAKTLWQIIPAVYRGEAKETAGTMMSMKTSTKVAFYNYERIYTVLSNGITYKDGEKKIVVPSLDQKKFQNHFNLTAVQWSNFMTLVMLNSYNTGERRMLQIMHWFKANYSASDIDSLNNQTELGLFSMMVDLAKSSGEFSRYGDESNGYVFASLGAAESLDSDNRLNYDKINSGGVVSEVGDWVHEKITDVGVPLATGIVAGAAIDNAFETSKQNPNKLPKKANRPRKLANTVSRYVKTACERTWRGGKALMKGDQKVKKQGGKLAHTISRRDLLKSGATLGVLSATGILANHYREEIGGLIGDFVKERVESGSGEISASEVPRILARLRSRGVFLTSSGARGKRIEEDGLSRKGNRTALVGMRKDVLGTFESLLENLELLDKTTNSESSDAIIVTGMAEDGHSQRTHGHGNGFAIDLRPSSADKISDKIINKSKVLSPTTQRLSTSRQLLAGNSLLESGMVVGEKVFRYSSKYFLFGLMHQGQTYVCYFDDESNHRHLELIPFENYSKSRIGIPGVFRQEVKNYIQKNV